MTKKQSIFCHFLLLTQHSGLGGHFFRAIWKPWPISGFQGKFHDDLRKIPICRAEKYKNDQIVSSCKRALTAADNLVLFVFFDSKNLNFSPIVMKPALKTGNWPPFPYWSKKVTSEHATLSQKQKMTENQVFFRHFWLSKCVKIGQFLNVFGL